MARRRLVGWLKRFGGSLRCTIVDAHKMRWLIEMWLIQISTGKRGCVDSLRCRCTLSRVLNEILCLRSSCLKGCCSMLMLSPVFLSWAGTLVGSMQTADCWSNKAWLESRIFHTRKKQRIGILFCHFRRHLSLWRMIRNHTSVSWLFQGDNLAPGNMFHLLKVIILLPAICSFCYRW